MSEHGQITPDESFETSVGELFAARDVPGVRDQLIERFLPLAQSLARRYLRSGQPLDDLTQIAYIGLINAVDRFDPSRGFSFQSYAVPTILGELKRYHRDRGWSIRVPRRLQENALMVKNAVPVLSQDIGRAPTISEIAECTALSEDDVLEAIEAQGAYSSVSIDAAYDGSDEGSSLAERISVEDGNLKMTEDWVEVVTNLRRLPVRERRIVALRYLADRTQGEIAEELGISQMHVSRLLRQTLASLRKNATDEAGRALEPLAARTSAR